VIGSGPPGTNYAVMKKAFDEGWGGMAWRILFETSSNALRTRTLDLNGTL